MRVESKLLLFFTFFICLGNFVIYYSNIFKISNIWIAQVVLSIVACWGVIVGFKYNLRRKLASFTLRIGTGSNTIEGLVRGVQSLYEEHTDTSKMLGFTANIFTDAFLIVDQEWQIKMANYSALLDFGPDLVGQDIREKSNISWLINIIASCTQLDYGMCQQSFITTAQKRSYMVTIKPYFANHNLKYFFITFRDIDKELLLEDRIKNYNRYLNHEIRTPITTVLNASEILMNDHSHDPQLISEFLPMIHQHAQKLALMVKDLGGFKINQEIESPSNASVFNISMVLKEILFELKNKISPKLIEVVVADLEVTLSRFLGEVHKLKALLTQVLENTIYNSKSEDHICIQLKKVKLKSNLNSFMKTKGIALKIAVIDKSRVINKEEVSRLTKMFYQVDSTSGQEMSSFDLGINESEPTGYRSTVFKIKKNKDKGCEFIIYFPVTPY